jgi:hypothetical protein
VYYGIGMLEGAQNRAGQLSGFARHMRIGEYAYQHAVTPKCLDLGNLGIMLPAGGKIRNSFFNRLFYPNIVTNL